MVARAVERADLGACEPARGLHLVGEEDRVDVGVLLPTPLEDAVPERLNVVDHGDDAAVLALVGVLAGLALFGDLARRVALADLLALQGPELAQPIAAPQERDEEEHDDPDQTEATAPGGQATWPRPAAANVGYLAGIETSPAAKTHDRCLPMRHPYQTRQKEKYDDLVMEIACGLHNFRVHCRGS